MSAAPKRFRIQSKSIFLTYPQCDYPLAEFHANIVAFFRSRSIAIAHGVVCRENHEDGNFHLHAAISLLIPLDSRDVRVFDALAGGKHPNIDGRFRKGVKAAYEYVMKEGNYLALPDESFSLLDFLATKKKESMSEIVVRNLRDGKNLDELDDQLPAYMLQNLKKVQDYANFLSLKKRRSEFAMAQQRKVCVEPAEGFSSGWNLELASWLTKNIRQPRSHRQVQMWVKAPPGAGKTSLIMRLEEMFGLSIYFWPRDEKWWDAYADGCYDLIVLDEYRSQKMITELNPILSGDPTPLSRRNSCPLVKRDNLPVIVLSNFRPEDCYTKVSSSQLAPLLDRLIVVEVPDGELIRIVEVAPPLSDDQPPPLADDVSSFGGIALPTEAELDSLRSPFAYGPYEDLDGW